MKELLELYLAFLRIGAVNFGGGYAMLPLLERDLVKDRGWTTTEDLTDYFAIGQCTPGLIALNVATFIGSRRKGVAGSIAATVGFVTMPIIIILIDRPGRPAPVEEIGRGQDEPGPLPGRLPDDRAVRRPASGCARSGPGHLLRRPRRDPRCPSG